MRCIGVMCGSLESASDLLASHVFAAAAGTARPHSLLVCFCRTQLEHQLAMIEALQPMLKARQNHHVTYILYTRSTSFVSGCCQHT